MDYHASYKRLLYAPVDSCNLGIMNQVLMSKYLDYGMVATAQDLQRLSTLCSFACSKTMKIPDQPRDDYGRWTSDGSDDEPDDSSGLPPYNGEPDEPVDAVCIRLKKG